MEPAVKALYISSGHNYYGRHGKGSLDHETMAVDSIDCVAGKGIKGDRFFDYKEDYKGQITFFDTAVWKDVELQMGKEIDPMSFRRNVLTEGCDLNQLIGKEFAIQGVTFYGMEECKPCYWMDEACGDGAEDQLKGRGGLRAKILTSGQLVRN